MTLHEIKDLERLMHWRREVIASVFGEEPSKALMESNRLYYLRHLADGTHIALEAEVDGHPAGCGAICLTEELPSPDTPSGRCAYLMNIYVRPGFRARGAGHAMVRELVRMACGLGCDKIYLETTQMGRSLYESLGFAELPGIMKYADTDDTES